MRRTVYSLFVATLLCCTAQIALAQDHLAIARQLYGAGRWEAAHYEFGRAPQTVETETFAAFCAARLHHPASAALLEGLLAKYPSSPYANEVRFRDGTAQYAAKNYSEALKLLQGVDAQKFSAGDRDEYHFKSGHSYFTAGEWGRARWEFASVSHGSELKPHADYYTAYMEYDAGNYAEAKRAFTRLSFHPSYSRLAPYYLLQIEFNEGNYPYVAENAASLIPDTASPRRAELAAMAAQSRFRLGAYDEALSDMELYRSEGGTMTRAENYLVGYSLYRETRYGEAAEYLSKVTGPADSLSQNASYHLADAYLKLGDKSNALRSFSIAATSGNDPVITEDALFNYGKLLYETGDGRFNEAINVLDRYLASYPTSPHADEVRDYLIAAYYNSNDYEAAYKAIISHPDPDNNVKAALQKITYFRALECYTEGDTVEAMNLLDFSEKYRYNNKYTALTAFWQGEILYSQGDWSAAIPKYEEYLRLSPATESENALARYNLGYCYFNSGKWTEAQKWFDDFLARTARTSASASHSATPAVPDTRQAASDSRPAVPDTYRADALNREGDIAHARREYWRAIETYDKAAAILTPEKYYSAYQRALMLGLVQRPERKIESLEAIIKKAEGPYVEDATYELGRTLIASDRYADGAKILAGFADRYPASGYYLTALSDLGLAYLNMGSRTEAMKAYKTIVESAPYSREAQDAMAGIRSLYVEANDIDGYFAYARLTGAPTDTGEVQRDSLTFAAAERIYLSGDEGKAITALENYLNATPKGRYVSEALSYLSGLYLSDRRYADAADAFHCLASASTDPATAGKAIEGYIASTIKTEDPDRILVMADEVTALKSLPEKSLREALFAKAGALDRMNTVAADSEALDIYRRLSADVRTVEGAESAYRVIENLYDEGDYAAAEQAVFDFSDKGTPHGYPLAEAFLILGDIYARQGDTFQARATYQSIVDGYSPSDDGIIAAAKERIANLK